MTATRKMVLDILGNEKTNLSLKMRNVRNQGNEYITYAYVIEKLVIL